MVLGASLVEYRDVVDVLAPLETGEKASEVEVKRALAARTAASVVLVNFMVALV